MRSSSRIALVACAALVASEFLVDREGVSRADLDNQVFTSTRYRVKLIVPRTWRVTEQPSYPGFLLWLMRSQPEGKIVVTGETFTRDLFCSWPVECRQSHDGVAARYACAIRAKLVGGGAAKAMKVGVVQAGPKENEEARWPSVWFEYADGSHFLRQAIAVAPDNRIISMVLATPTEDARRAHVRAFDQMLRSLATTEEAAPESGSGSSGDVGSSGSGSAGSGSASAPANGPTFSTLPLSTENPIGPCS